jgi:5'-methylthioadenosine phosphorylase
MTQYPETALAREAAMCVFNLSFVSDLDAGIKGLQDEAVTAGMVWRIVRDNQPRIVRALASIVSASRVDPECLCHKALSDV